VGESFGATARSSEASSTAKASRKCGDGEPGSETDRNKFIKERKRFWRSMPPGGAAAVVTAANVGEGRRVLKPGQTDGLVSVCIQYGSMHSLRAEPFVVGDDFCEVGPEQVVPTSASNLLVLKTLVVERNIWLVDRISAL